MDDEKIVDLYLARDESAISRTAEKYGMALRRIAYRILESTESSEECENDTYWEAWKSIPPNEPRTYLFPYLGRITRHLAIDTARKMSAQKRSSALCELTKEIEECIPGPDDLSAGTDAGDLAEILNCFLGQLKEDQRYIFVRRYWFFDSVQDIAKRTSFSQSKVKMTLLRTRNRLRDYLLKEGYNP